MSVKVSGWVWELQLPPTEKLVLLKLADHAHHDGSNVRPGVREISTATGIGERQVQRYLKSFVDRGFLLVEDRETGGRGYSRVYRFAFRKGDMGDTLSDPQKGDMHDTLLTQEKGDTGDTLSGEKGDMGDMERVSPMTQKGDMGDATLKGVNRQEPSVNRQRARARARSERAKTTDEKLIEKFDRFWSVYPRRVKRQYALKAFARIDPDDALLEVMINAVELAKLTRQWREAIADGELQYIPHPSTWLNAAQWEDEVTPATPAAAGPPGVELLPGEKAVETSPGSWELTGADGRKRFVDPAYHGVVFDSRIHAEDQRGFWTAVEQAKSSQGVTHGRS